MLTITLPSTGSSLKKGAQHLGRATAHVQHMVNTVPRYIQKTYPTTFCIQSEQNKKVSMPTASFKPFVPEKVVIEDTPHQEPTKESSPLAPTTSSVAPVTEKKQTKNSASITMVGGVPIDTTSLQISSKNIQAPAQHATKSVSIPPCPPITGCVGRHLGPLGTANPEPQPKPLKQVEIHKISPEKIQSNSTSTFKEKRAALRHITPQETSPRTPYSVNSSYTPVLSGTHHSIPAQSTPATPALRHALSPQETQNNALVPLPAQQVDQPLTLEIVENQQIFTPVPLNQVRTSFTQMATQADQAGMVDAVSCLIDQTLLTNILAEQGFIINPGVMNMFADMHGNPIIIVNPVEAHGLIPCILGREAAEKLIAAVATEQRIHDAPEQLFLDADQNAQELFIIAPQNPLLANMIQQTVAQISYSPQVEPSIPPQQSAVVYEQAPQEPAYGIQHGFAEPQNTHVLLKKPVHPATPITQHAPTGQAQVAFVHGTAQLPEQRILTKKIPAPVQTMQQHNSSTPMYGVQHGFVQTNPQNPLTKKLPAQPLIITKHGPAEPEVTIEHGTAPAHQEQVLTKRTPPQPLFERIRWVVSVPAAVLQAHNVIDIQAHEIVGEQQNPKTDIRAKEERARVRQTDFGTKNIPRRRLLNEERQEERERTRNRNNRRLFDPARYRQRRFVTDLPERAPIIEEPVLPVEPNVPPYVFPEPEVDSDDNDTPDRSRPPRPPIAPPDSPVVEPLPTPPTPPTPPPAPPVVPTGNTIPIPQNGAPQQPQPATPSRIAPHPIYQPTPYSEQGTRGTHAGTPQPKSALQKKNTTPHTKNPARRTTPSRSGNNYNTPSWQQPNYYTPETDFSPMGATISSSEKTPEGTKQYHDTPWKKSPNAYGLPLVKNKTK